MNKRIFSLFCLIIAFQAFDARAQNTHLYLSTDHEIYFPGQDIHLKIWQLFDSRSEKKNAFVFIELYASPDEIISRKTVECTNEGAAAKFTVSPSASSGYYMIRAYTSDMKERGEQFFAYRKIMIINPAIDNRFPFPQKRTLSGKTIRATFFAEGGKIVKGIVNRVYVSFENLPEGMLKNAYVFNSFQDSVALLKSLDEHTAFFDFVPYSGQYEIRIPGVYPHRPVIIPEGENKSYSLKYTESIRHLQFIVQKNDTSLHFGNLRIKIDNLKNDETEIIDLGSEMILNYDQLQPGFNRFRLISEMDSVLAVNYYFKKEESSVSVKFSNSPGLVNPRKNIKLKLKVDSDSNSPGEAILNIFVRRKDREILENPGILDAYNFRKIIHLEPEWDLSSQEHLNAVAVIFGPEMFDNKGIIKNDPGTEDEREFYLKGRFYDGILSGLNIYLSFPGDSSQLFVTKTANDGSFSFPVRSVHGEKQLFIKSEDSLSHGFISIEDPFYSDFYQFRDFPSSLDSLQLEFLDRTYQEWILNQVYDQAASPRTDNSVRPAMFYDQADFHLLMDNYVEFPNMEEVFFEIVKPVMILREDRKPYLKVIDRETNRTIGDRPLYVIDGVAFTDPQIAFSLNPVNVRDISVIERKYFIGLNSFDGIIIINTRSNNLSDLDPSMVYLRQNAVFPESDNAYYFSRVPGSVHKPFNFPTIYWDSNHKTGKDGSATISFIAPDVPGEYEIWVETVDIRTGEPGAGSFVFTVGDE
jgi:hypothetical protein